MALNSNRSEFSVNQQEENDDKRSSLENKPTFLSDENANEILKYPNIIDLEDRFKDIESSMWELVDKHRQVRREHKYCVRKVPSLTICPIPVCPRVVAVKSILGHFMKYHQDMSMQSYVEAKTGEKTIIKCPSKYFEANQEICLGIILYSGITNDETELPANKGLCRHNAALPEKYIKYEAYWPFFIFGSKCSTRYLDSQDKDKTDNDENIDNNYKDLYVFWATSIDTGDNIKCRLIAYDKDHCNSKSKLVSIRHLKDAAHNPKEFLSEENNENYLMLDHDEIDEMTEKRLGSISIEVSIEEC